MKYFWPSALPIKYRGMSGSELSPLCFYVEEFLTYDNSGNVFAVLVFPDHLYTLPLASNCLYQNGINIWKIK